MKKLLRNKKRAIFGGVCAGLEDFTGVDVSLIRLGVVIVSIFTVILPAIIFYLAAWVIIPKMEDQI